MTNHCLLFGAVVVLIPVGCSHEREPILDRAIYTDTSGNSLPYRMFRPADRSRKLPLVVFLHGAGERGNDNERQLTHGVFAFLTEDHQTKYPCYLLAPQCPEAKKWVEVDWSADAHQQPLEPAEPLRLTLELIESLLQHESIDPERVYLTGLSMGGYGTWDLLARRPDLFAAGVPICGGADEATAVKLTKMPIWAFHGAKDEVVGVNRSRNMIEALERAGGQPKYTEFPTVGHDSWTATYADPNLFAWLFAQRRK